VDQSQASELLESVLDALKEHNVSRAQVEVCGLKVQVEFGPEPLEVAPSTPPSALFDGEEEDEYSELRELEDVDPKFALERINMGLAARKR